MLGFDAVAKLPLAAAPGAGSVLDAASGSFTVSGRQADLRRNALLGAASGSFTVSGQPADFRREGLLSKVIQADPGAYAYDGLPATVNVVLPNRVFEAASGTYSYGGLPAALNATWYDTNSSVRLVTFKFIRSNTVSILAEDRVIKIEPRLRKSNSLT